MRIKFLGAARQVTGSSYYLDDGDVRILVDCGLFQERHFCERNWKPFPVPPKKIDYLLLTHVHLDHSGLIPRLVEEGFRGRILLTPASHEMFPIVLLDSAHIQEEDAAFKQKRHKQEERSGPYPEKPLYTAKDVQMCLPLLQDTPYDEFVQLTERIKVRFHNAGHILGSAMVEIVFSDGAGTRNIVFSGDIGQYDTPLLSDPAAFAGADYVVMESTYGGREHDESEGIDDKLSRIIGETLAREGNVLIPAFAIERSQELLFHFGRLVRAGRIPRVPVFLDSPMAVEITKVFENCRKYLDPKMLALFAADEPPFEFPGLKLVETTADSKAINDLRRPCIIMSGSGMITGGRIKHHLIRNITRPESTLLFVGYQAAGTLGRLILDGVSPIRILGQEYPVLLHIEHIDGFSAHAGMSDLLRWLSGFTAPPRHVFLTHGEEQSILDMSSQLHARGGWQISAPTYLEEFTI